MGYFAADHGFANCSDYKFYFEHSQLSKLTPQGGFLINGLATIGNPKTYAKPN